MSSARRRMVRAAGALLWRRRRGELQVALVHRPAYDDWSWPKGKLEQGEDFAAAAAREVEEETGLVPRLGVPLPRALYVVGDDELKEVRYWAAQVAGGPGRLLHEVDQVRWAGPAEAQSLLTHERDGLQLESLVEADADGLLDTWPLVVVRHAESLSRLGWREDDLQRPLSEAGRDRAQAMAGLLAAYQPQRVISSPAARCLETLEPFGHRRGTRVRTKPVLGEETAAVDPDRTVALTRKVLRRATPAMVCTHRPVLPLVLGVLLEHAPMGSVVAGTLGELARSGMDKGEVLVCHVTGSGPGATVVSAERHRPT